METNLSGPTAPETTTLQPRVWMWNACVCSRATRPHSQKFSHNEKPVVKAGRWRAYTLCTPALSHLDLFTHIRDAPRPNHAPVFPSGVFTAEPSTSDQQPLRTRLMGVVCRVFFFGFFFRVHAQQFKWLWLTAPRGPLKTGELLIGVFPVQPYLRIWPPLPLLLFPCLPFFSPSSLIPSPLKSRCHLSLTSLLLCISAVFCCQLVWLLCQGAGHWLSLCLTSKAHLNVSINIFYSLVFTTKAKTSFTKVQ